METASAGLANELDVEGETNKASNSTPGLAYTTVEPCYWDKGDWRRNRDFGGEGR